MKFFKIKNNSNFDLSNSEELFHGLGQFAQKRFGFKKPPILNLVSDEENAGKLLGKTAYYDPQSLAVTIYTDNRHAKDILRSLAHELVHHTQNENGMLNDSGYHGQGYAQKNKDLRKSEKEAYLKGNMCFRDWEDQLKQDKPTIYNEWRINTMSTKDWKRKELMENLTEKFGFKMDLKKLNEGKIPPQLEPYVKGEKKDSDEDEESEEESEESSEKKESSKTKKPDFPDVDGDGDRKEPISKAQKDKKEKQNESRIYKFIKQEIRKQLMEAKKKSKMPDKYVKDSLKNVTKQEADKEARRAKGQLTKKELEEKIESFKDAIKRAEVVIKNAEDREQKAKKDGNDRRARLSARTVEENKSKIEKYEKEIKKAEDSIEKLSK